MKTKKVRISNDRLNSYGTRVLTAGLDVEQFRRNPVLLYQHQRGVVIGVVDHLEVTDDEVVGELVFDEATELSRQCRQQWEFGSLRMVSVGIEVVEMSEDAKVLVPGQTRPTITRSRLLEVSLVDIGANDDAIVLHRDGKRLELGQDGTCCLPLLSNHKTEKQMMEQDLALLLGLDAGATPEAMEERVQALLSLAEENERLVQQVQCLQRQAVEGAVEGAIAQRRLSAEKRETFVQLGCELGVERLSEVLEAMPIMAGSAPHLCAQLQPKEGRSAYERLGQVPADELERLRRDDVVEYQRLYRAEYGMECEW